MTYVTRRSGESFNSMFKRFRKRVNRDRIKSELRKRRYFITKGEKDRIAHRKAERKARQRLRKNQSRNRW
ncbi:MAG: 30S ribosomal protein S21 [Anaerolineales bacterium]